MNTLGALCGLYLVAVLVASTIGCVIRVRMAREDAALRKTSPEVWIRKRELEAGAKQRKHERARIGFGLGAVLIRILLGKYLK